MCDCNRMHDMAKQLHITIFQMLIFSLIYLVTTLSPPPPHYKPTYCIRIDWVRSEINKLFGFGWRT